jgi:hypothetical protein
MRKKLLCTDIKNIQFSIRNDYCFQYFKIDRKETIYMKDLLNKLKQITNTQQDASRDCCV